MAELTALILLGCAVAVYGWSVWLFATRGRGTPLPLAPPQELVVQGPYRCTRNPMALAVVVGAVGLSLLFGSLFGLLGAVLLAVVLHIYITRWEEPTLVRRFGESYVTYCKRVPRWVPKSPRRTRAGG